MEPARQLRHEGFVMEWTKLTPQMPADWFDQAIDEVIKRRDLKPQDVMVVALAKFILSARLQGFDEFGIMRMVHDRYTVSVKRKETE